MNRFFFRTACFLLALAIALGAMGAHAIKDRVNAYELDIYNKAALYHFLNGIGMLVLSIVCNLLNKRGVYALWFLFAGIILFSGSLYSLATLNLCGMLAIKPVLVIMTPIGGICFITGWILAAFSIQKNDN